MRIIGGYQDGNEQKRVVVLEESDRSGKMFTIEATITGDRGEEGIDLQVFEYGKDKPLDDHLAMGEVPLGKQMQDAHNGVSPWGLMARPHACIKCGNQNPEDLAYYYGQSGTGYQPYCRPDHGCDVAEVKP